jgi:CofD-related protein of GAK system
MNEGTLEPLKHCVDKNDDNGSLRQSRRDRKREKLRTSSFSDSLDDISSTSDDNEGNSTFNSSLHRRLGNDNENESDRVVTITRELHIPDNVRVERSLRLPEFGPKILFFSGGTAIRDLSACLINYTHNSIHLITPFDSGGSSAEIRRGFDMLSVGDIRNRLLALSDKNESTMRNNPQIIELFSHRLTTKADDTEASVQEFLSVLHGKHPLIRAVEMPMRSILQNHLRWFAKRMPVDFDLRGASIGNLIITGCFLEHNRDIVTAIFMITKFLGVKGLCRPLTAANLHIRTLYDDDRVVVGQHAMNSVSKSQPCHQSAGNNSSITNSRKIVKIDLVRELHAERQQSQSCHIDILCSDLVSSTADLICFPMGSFFASILVNLLPRGVGRAIAERRCPKVYIPNTGYDPEMTGRTLAECVSLIIAMIREDPCHIHHREHRGQKEDGGHQVETKQVVPVESILNFVLLDTVNCEYYVPVDKNEIENLGVTVIDMPLVEDTMKNAEICATNTSDSDRRGKSKILNPQKVVEVLISLSS